MDNEPRQAGAEIEVTKEMIEAALPALACYHQELFNEEDILRAVFKSMLHCYQDSLK